MNSIIGPIDLIHWNTLLKLKNSISILKKEKNKPKRLGVEEETYKLILGKFRG